MAWKQWSLFCLYRRENFSCEREHCASCCALLFRDDSRAMELEACLFRWCDMQGTYNLSAEKILLFRCPTALKR